MIDVYLEYLAGMQVDDSLHEDEEGVASVVHLAVGAIGQTSPLALEEGLQRDDRLDLGKMEGPLTGCVVHQV